MAKKKPQEAGEFIVVKNPFKNPFHMALSDAFGGFSSRWRKVNHAKMDVMESHALLSLKDAGLVELRLSVKIRWIGYPYLLQALFEVCGEETDTMLDEEWRELASAAPGWTDEESSEAKILANIFPVAGRLSARGISLSPPSFSPLEVLDILTLLPQGKLPPAPPTVNLIDTRSWVPSKLQMKIWNALDGWVLTADGLQKLASRSTLYKDPGGLSEMLELGLVANDRRVGGYYRPDSAPKI